MMSRIYFFILDICFLWLTYSTFTQWAHWVYCRTVLPQQHSSRSHAAASARRPWNRKYPESTKRRRLALTSADTYVFTSNNKRKNLVLHTHTHTRMHQSKNWFREMLLSVFSNAANHNCLFHLGTRFPFPSLRCAFLFPAPVHVSVNSGFRQRLKNVRRW